MADAKLEMLRRVPLFSRLDDRSLEEVARLADEVDIRPEQVLMREGRSGHEFFLILRGTVRVERAGELLNVCGRGDFLGEIALVDGGPRTATAIAQDEVRALVVGHREFHSLMDQFPALRLRVLEALAERVRRAEPERPH
jgi:CRP/FNR family cyclic AMP-dependent transcriptional regulator